MSAPELPDVTSERRPGLFIDAPVSAVEADVLFAGLADAGSLLLAVSGGPDSLAMLYLASEWRRQGLARAEPRPTLHVAVVDHGLRVEAAAEAAMVVGHAHDLGIDGAILTWGGSKPGTGIQAAARAARYQLLFDHAMAIGASHLVTAHHADDLAETILMRLCAGSGLAGLAGMSGLNQRGSIWLARPLLSLSKARLVATCEANGVVWALDPGNLDARKGRGRLRLLAGQLEALGLRRERLLRLGRRAARADAALEHAVDVALAGAGVQTRDNGFSVDLARLALEPVEINIRAIGRLLSGASANPSGELHGYARLERLERVAELLMQAVRENRPATTTLGGMVLRVDRNGICQACAEKPRRGNGSGPHASNKALLGAKLR